MTLTVRVESRRWQLVEQKLTPGEVDALVRATALEIEADVKASIQGGTKTGRLYKRRRRLHQASAPGQAPATDTGKLASSYRARRMGAGVWRVGSSSAYAAPLEFGGRRVLPRPHLRPAFKSAGKRLEKRLRALLEAK